MDVTMERSKAQLSAISRLFSTTVLRQMYAKAQSPLFARLAGQTGLIDDLPLTTRVRDFFDIAFGILKRIGHRDEYIYRSAIANRILMGTHSLNTATILNEFRVGDSVADVVILNGTSTVYEIKSERDTLKRLRSQLINYSDVFAQTYVIVGHNHVEAVIEDVPPGVGVLSLSQRYQISTVREARCSYSNVDPVGILNSVRVTEAKAILKLLGCRLPDVPNTRMHLALRDAFEELDPVMTHDAMVSVLRETRSAGSLADLVEALPMSLHANVLATRPGGSARRHLLEAVDADLSEALVWG